jgi:glutamate 5-kinase
MEKLVIKIGTASISRTEGDGRPGLDESRINALAGELTGLQKGGRRIILVTSGAIGAGMDAFGWTERPTRLADKQAAAAVGQPVLMEAYKKAFGSRGVTTAQVLLSRADLEDRERYLNTRNTLDALLERNVLPILNENDTVATDEIRFGDNDTLAALIAAKTSADRLFLLTDVEGLLTSTGAEGQLLPEVFQITPDVEALVQSGTGSKKSTGGMATKVAAARIAMASGVEVWIASGKRPGVVTEILEGHGVGTRFQPKEDALNSRRRWIAGLKPKGTLYVDAGAVTALIQGKKSLLPSGIARVEGRFSSGDPVRVVGPDGREVGRGLAAYSSLETQRIKGRKTSELSELLKRPHPPQEDLHRNNLALLG